MARCQLDGVPPSGRTHLESIDSWAESIFFLTLSIDVPKSDDWMFVKSFRKKTHNSLHKPYRLGGMIMDLGFHHHIMKTQVWAGGSKVAAI